MKLAVFLRWHIKLRHTKMVKFLKNMLVIYDKTIQCFRLKIRKTKSKTNLKNKVSSLLLKKRFNITCLNYVLVAIV